MPEKTPQCSSHFKHTPVLANEVLRSINELPEKLLNEGLIIDATLGGGGHSALILEQHPKLKIIGLDQDPEARTAASKRLEPFGSRVKIIETNFADFIPAQKVNFVLADLGVSSHQLSEPKRGFSFLFDGPLDMRMNPTQKKTAAQLIQTLNERQIADLIFKYGEERFARRIARKLKEELTTIGQYKGTKELAYSIAGCYPPKLRYGRIHPATKTFQALRIAVNDELKVLEELLKKAPNWLKEEGLIGIISFHSLEDRQVKKAFMTDERLERVTKKPIQASSEEISQNPRSRSAKLRIARRTNKLEC